MLWGASVSQLGWIASVLWSGLLVQVPVLPDQRVERDDREESELSNAGAPGESEASAEHSSSAAERPASDDEPPPPEDAAELPLPGMPDTADLPIEASSGDLPPVGTDPGELPTADDSKSELFGHFGFEMRFFPLSPASDEQPRYYDASLVFKPGYALELTRFTTVRAIGFVRLDQHDPERSHFDAREALIQTRSGALTLTLGVNKVFWGVTESRHLVDIVNQTDLLEDFSGDAKYGQPMLMASYDTQWVGSFQAIVDTWFRPQRYPSPSGRPAVPFPLLGEVYESPWKRYQPDLALRWSHSVGGFDWALSYFYGTSRQPELTPVVVFGINPPFIPFFEVALEPYYALIHQGGLELQWTHSGWLWKLEGMARHGQGPNFLATTLGFEYTFTGAFGTSSDLGLLLEYNYDGRDNATLNIYDSDLFGGVRLSPNDEAGTELLVGVLTDVESGATSGSLKGSRRLGDHWKLVLEGRVFWADDLSDPLYWFRRDHYASTTIEYHF